MTTRPDLTQDEIDAICAGITQHAAQCRYLRSLGLWVERRPNGQPLVWRNHAEQVLSGRQSPATAANDASTTTPPPAPAGNRAALVQLFQRRAA